jgi:hypothetical protein
MSFEIYCRMRDGPDRHEGSYKILARAKVRKNELMQRIPSGDSVIITDGKDGPSVSTSWVMLLEPRRARKPNK